MKHILQLKPDKLDPIIQLAYTEVSRAAVAAQVDLLIIGATARDLIYRHIYGIPIKRFTRDTDFAVQVENWAKFDELTNIMVDSFGFVRTRKPHRFEHKRIKPWVDIVPFGGITDENADLKWRTEPEVTFSTLGFEEALNTAIKMTLETSGKQNLVLNVVHPAVLVMLKVFAWKERKRGDDAADVAFAMSNYTNIGNTDRLYSDSTLLEGDFDMDTVGARLVGRDIKLLVAGKAIHRLNEIIEAEEALGEASAFVADMARSDVLAIDKLYVKMLHELLVGLTERSSPSMEQVLS